MNTVEELQSAIRELSRDDRAKLRVWLNEFAADTWDCQIEADAHNGRLDAFYQSLQAENEGQPDIPLDKFLRQTEP